MSMGVAKYIKQLGSETAIYGVSATLNCVIGVFLVPIYTRVFSPTDYGIVAIMTTCLSFFNIVVVLGLDNSSARWYYATEDDELRKGVISAWFWCQLAFSIAIALVVTIFASPISRLLLGSDNLTTVIWIAVWLIPLGVFNTVLGNWLRYQRRAALTTIYFLVSSLGMVCLIILFVVIWHKGLAGLYEGQVVAAILTMIVATFIFWSWISPRYFSWHTLKEMLQFGLPLALAAAASWVTASSDRLYLQMFDGLKEVGIYAIAVAVAAGVGLFTGAFQMAWGPFAFSILNEPNSKEVYSKVFNLYTLLGCWLCTAVSLFAPIILYFFTTPDYFSAASSVPWLVFSNLAVGATYIAVMGTSIVKKSMPIAVSIFIGAGLTQYLTWH